MRRIWDVLGMIAVTAMVIYAGYVLIKPYVPLLLLASIIVLVCGGLWRGYQRRRYW